jgi:hypothetical protein
MSSFTNAYIVAPNSSVSTPIIPSPTQLNGTGALVDLVPTIITKGSSIVSLPVSNATTTIYTFPSALAAGTYLITYNLQLLRDGGGANWNTNEYAYTEVYTSSGFPADYSAIATFQPYYQTNLAPGGDVFFPVSGFIQLTSTQTPIITVTRNGTQSANKSAAVFFVSCQKVE